jgi:uncharacterized protein with von Willebrand factor type A (vWA) domain
MAFTGQLDQQLTGLEHKDEAARPGEKASNNPVRKSPDLVNGPGISSTPSGESSARVSFGSTREGDGLTLPRLLASPAIAEEYILHTQTVVSARDMVVLWRRYRRTTRRGPRTELDIAGTIRERCRRGVLLQPVCRSRRSNSARLLILADASPSMAPWLPFLSMLQDSLRFARFARVEMHYFTNLPRKQLYADTDFVDPEQLDQVFRRFAGASLLVVSEGGSARGYLNRRRAVQTNTFLSGASGTFGTIVWLNPMPRSRWVNTTPALIAGDSSATMLPLAPDQLMRAIDSLRGNK